MSDLKPKPKRNKITSRRCCLPHCRKSKRDNPNYRFFKFPEYGSPFFMQWVKNCNLSEEFIANSSSLCLCQDHFAKAAIGKKFLKRGTLPVLYLTTKYQGAESESTDNQDVDLSILKSPARKRIRADSPADISRQCHDRQNFKRMSQGKVCRLCANICQDYKCIYDQNGHENETYQLMMKYFDSTFLNMDNGGYLSVMCLECWGHILDFNNFQQSVYQAQLRLNDTEQKPEIIAENELNSKDVATYHASKELGNSQKEYVKSENNSTVEISSQANAETICYVITRQEEDLLPNTSQAIADVSVKRVDAILLEKNHTAQLKKPKLETVDVYSGDNASQEPFSQDASVNEVFESKSIETICYVITRQEDDLLPNTSQALGDVSVKTEDSILLETKHTALEETALTKPKLEIVDVYSGDDASEE